MYTHQRMNHQTVTTKQIRNNLADIVDQVAVAGKSFVITKFGKKRAMIVPLQADQTDSAISNFENALHETFGAWDNSSTTKNQSKKQLSKSSYQATANAQVQSLRKPRHEIFS